MTERLLVANRGEIARRVIRTCRAMGIAPVAVYADPDEGAPHVREADLAVRLPGATAGQTYLNAELLLAAARRGGADAVHPGYGFLSESAELARLVLEAGLTWVGPPPAAIAAMGSKMQAKRRMSVAGVPTLPSWTPQEVPPDATYPLLVKACYGGGGRGMRVVRQPGELAAAITAAQGEASAAFGDGTVFVEWYLDESRHVEVQVIADGHGTVVALGERECSIQRRHQKIIEETPSPAVHEALRAGLGEAAVTAMREIGYVGAGTVEFLLTPDGEFYFLEVNTRLQVEHPVTECVLGLDLVRLQIEVAEGRRLPFSQDSAPRGRGHAIEARLYAEDPAEGWRPATGILHCFEVPDVDARFAVPPGYGLRLDSGVETGGTVSRHYDPLLAKLVAWAPTRVEASRRLAAALLAARLHGVRTNRDLLVRTLQHPAFRSGDTHTGFLDEHPEVLAPLLDQPGVGLSALAAALAGAQRRRAAAPVLGTLPAGWRNNRSQPGKASYHGPGGLVEVDYQPLPPGLYAPSVTPAEVLLVADGIQRRYRVHQVAGRCYVDGPHGAVELTEVDRLPAPGSALAAGSLVAPMPGTVLRTAVGEGDRVRAGDLLLTLEAMKMEHSVTAPGTGTVTELRVSAGSQVDTGALLVVVKPDRDGAGPAPGTG